MLAGWEAEGLAPSVILDRSVNPASLPPAHHLARRIEEVPDGFSPSLIILAVKPQKAAEAMEAIASLARGATVLSVMAGRRLAGLRAALPEAGGIVRAMPNTPSSIGRGASVAVAEPRVPAEARALCDRLLRAVGSAAWVEDEELLDPVTAVSGSGPAYVFLLAELLEAAGRAQGLPPALARQLARDTVAGAGALLAASGEDASDLRRAVTSPNGTTAAALSVLMAEAAWPDAMRQAIEAATQRSRELAS